MLKQLQLAQQIIRPIVERRRRNKNNLLVTTDTVELCVGLIVFISESVCLVYEDVFELAQVQFHN